MTCVIEEDVDIDPGPLFIPAYLLASTWLGLRGFNAYLDNPFEVEAYAIDDPRAGDPM